GSLVESITGGVGSQREVVQRLWRTTAVDDDLTCVQHQANIAGDVLLRLGDESVQRTLQWGVPQTVIDLFRPTSIRKTLVACQLALQGDIFQCLVRTNQGDCTWRVVDFTGLDANDTVFNHGQAANALCTCTTVQLFDSLEHSDLLAIDGYWLAL